LRFLIFLLLVYFAYRLLKRWVIRQILHSQDRMATENRPLTAVDDIMVQDPFCKTYFPQRSGVHLNFKGENFYFCSPKCRDNFLRHQKENELGREPEN
jgi:YHS domain-containing protein